jgi:phage baseplate assembly protein W
MPDISHLYGGGLSLSPTGDLAMADGATLTLQRVLRRLLTSRGKYIWQLDYGAGLPSMVGRPVNERRIQALVLLQMKQESTVLQNPPPTATVTQPTPGTVVLTINYTDATTGTVQTATQQIG